MASQLQMRVTQEPEHEWVEAWEKNRAVAELGLERWGADDKLRSWEQIKEITNQDDKGPLALISTGMKPSNSHTKP